MKWEWRLVVQMVYLFMGCLGLVLGVIGIVQGDARSLISLLFGSMFLVFFLDEVKK